MKLQPLRIEASWLVSYNQLYEVDPTPGHEHYFEGSSLLMLKNNTRLNLINVEWRPELDLNGEYQIQVLNFVEKFNPKTNAFDADPNWDNPFLTFTTKSRLQLVDKLEELMRTLPAYQDPRMTKIRGVVDEVSESYRLSLEENGISVELVKKILEHGNDNIQRHTLNSNEITKEIIMMFSEHGITKKVKNIANQKLKSRQFKD